MPNYYLISEIPDEPDEVIYDKRTYQKPEAYDLLLPAVHNSRSDNVLRTDAEPQGAVNALLDACRESFSWPSSTFCSTENDNDRPVSTQQETDNWRDHEPTAVQHADEPTTTEAYRQPPKVQKYKLPFWAYDSVEPHVIDAARSLFFERKRQQAMYDAFSTWNNPTSMPRMLSDYELFAAWASLARSDKMTYISEVNGGLSFNLPKNMVETQRAVSCLYASCPDSPTWPSFTYAQIQPPPHLVAYPPPYKLE